MMSLTPLAATPRPPAPPVDLTDSARTTASAKPRRTSRQTGLARMQESGTSGAGRLRSDSSRCSVVPPRRHEQLLFRDVTRDARTHGRRVTAGRNLLSTDCVRTRAFASRAIFQVGISQFSEALCLHSGARGVQFRTTTTSRRTICCNEARPRRYFERAVGRRPLRWPRPSCLAELRRLKSRHRALSERR